MNQIDPRAFFDRQKMIYDYHDRSQELMKFNTFTSTTLRLRPRFLSHCES